MMLSQHEAINSILNVITYDKINFIQVIDYVKIFQLNYYYGKGIIIGPTFGSSA